MSEKTEVRDGACAGARASRAEYGSDLIVDLFEAHGIEYAAWNPTGYDNRSYYNDEEHQILMANARIEAWGPIEDPADIRPAVERAARYVLKERRAALVDVFTQFR